MAVALLAFLACAGAEAAPVAKILELHGAVSVLSAGKTVAASAGMALEQGARLALPAGAHATLALAAGAPLRLTGPVEHELATPATAPARPSLFAGVFERLLALGDTSALPDSAPGIVRGDKIEPVYPLGRLAERPAVLRWADTAPATARSIAVRGLDGTEVFASKASGGAVSLPAAKVVHGGKYTWEVAGASAYFELVDRSEAASLAEELRQVVRDLEDRSDSAAYHLLAGAFYESRGVLGSALAAYRAGHAAARDGSTRDLCRKAELAVLNKLR